MRIFFTSLIAFFLSGFAGGLVAQALAVWTGATEEYILVFAAIALVVAIVTFVFFIAQFFGNATNAVNRAAVALLILFAIALIGLVGLDICRVSGAPRDEQRSHDHRRADPAWRRDHRRPLAVRALAHWCTLGNAALRARRRAGMRSAA